ncbi:Yae1 protein [Saccharomycopsis crataegensis]|uniref:Protein YAE1 n=1 Tax=Saccharomycopsis crataegensis TaxID=43959 RepID=A0AAV5QWK4_9ASCO|nr:Yae1 protein [Saccharomycopsis crataegensis]
MACCGGYNTGQCCGGNQCPSPENNNDHNDDDVWADHDDLPQQTIASDSPDIVALRRKFAKEGYIDGKSQWQELGLQQGFDQGYPIGAKLAMQSGCILGKLQMIVTTYENEKDHELLKQCTEELNITNVLDSKYFDQTTTELIGDDHPAISKWRVLVEEAVKSRTSSSTTTID